MVQTGRYGVCRPQGWARASAVALGQLVMHRASCRVRFRKKQLSRVAGQLSDSSVPPRVQSSVGSEAPYMDGPSPHVDASRVNWYQHLIILDHRLAGFPHCVWFTSTRLGPESHGQPSLGTLISRDV